VKKNNQDVFLILKKIEDFWFPVDVKLSRSEAQEAMENHKTVNPDATYKINSGTVQFTHEYPAATL